MKAVLLKEFGSTKNMYIGDWGQPIPLPYEVLVKVKATALNRADTLQRKGQYPPPKGENPIMGLEMAGEVVALGEKVTQWQVGDRICGLLAGGGYAQYAVIHEKMAMQIPDNLNYEEAAAIPEVFLTAYQALVLLARLQTSESVLIHAGASGVGTAAIQLARQIGASVYTTASKKKCSFCEDLGAKKAINYKKKNFEEVILKRTDGKGVDVIVDFIAAPYFQQNLNSLALDGRMILLALMGGVKAEQFNMAPILMKRLKVIGSTLRSRHLGYKIMLTQQFQQDFWTSFEEGTIKPVIDTVYDWTSVAEAHDYMEANKNIGKIVLTVSS